MASRASLNKVMLIGNLTRDPEMRYTPSGAAVCTFGIATNRYYTASDGEKKEETEFIKIVSWNKLAELCSQLLSKGRKVYVDGRLQTRSWETPDGQPRQTTEVVIDDMRILDSRRDFDGEGGSTSSYPKDSPPPTKAPKEESKDTVDDKKETDKAIKKQEKKVSNDTEKKIQKDENNESKEDVDLDDLPF